jgi:hypothetical protein
VYFIAGYTSCIANSHRLFTNTVSQPNKSEADSGPSIGTIVGAAVGAFAALGLIAASAWYVVRHLKNNQIENEGSSSDINPIVTGLPDLGVATNSVAPAGTC